MRITRVAEPGKLTLETELRLNALDANTFLCDPPYEPKREAYWWIVSQGDLDVAFAGLTLLTGKQKGCAFLCRCGVLPAYRGRGLQRRLVRARERLARKLGCKAVLGFTARDNYASANSFIGAGYKLIKPWAPWCGDDGIYVRRELSARVLSK